MNRRDRAAAADLQATARELRVAIDLILDTVKFTRAALIATGKITPTAEDLAPHEDVVKAERRARFQVVQS